MYFRLLFLLVFLFDQQFLRGCVSSLLIPNALLSKWKSLRIMTNKGLVNTHASALLAPRQSQRNVLTIHEYSSKSNSSVLVALCGNRNDLDHFSRHTLNISQINTELVYTEVNITSNNESDYINRYGSLWKSGLFMIQADSFLNALRRGNRNHHNINSNESRTSFDELLANGRLKMKNHILNRQRNQRLILHFLDRLSSYNSSTVNVTTHFDRLNYQYNPNISTLDTKNKLFKFATWFKEYFPYYHNECHLCKDMHTNKCRENRYLGMVCSSVVESLYMANRTELYLCGNCSEVTRFPRYHDVTKVTETRRGRCGEYSMLMLLLLETLGYTVRYVADREDHCWVEVLLDDTYWMHLDPCEAVLDEPLLYEQWGKNQTYILSFESVDNDSVRVSDVTRRYTSNYTAVLERRNMENISEEYITSKLLLATV